MTSDAGDHLFELWWEHNVRDCFNDLQAELQWQLGMCGLGGHRIGLWQKHDIISDAKGGLTALSPQSKGRLMTHDFVSEAYILVYYLAMYLCIYECNHVFLK